MSKNVRYRYSAIPFSCLKKSSARSWLVFVRTTQICRPFLPANLYILAGFLCLVREWSSSLYNTTAVVNALMEQLRGEPDNATLLRSLGAVIEEDTDGREGKGRPCCLGNVLECRTCRLCSSKESWFEEKFLKEHPFCQVVGLVWCEPDDHPFFWIIQYTKRLSFYFFKSSWC